MSLDTTIEYHTRGTIDDRCDRGRSLGALDSELLGILMPTHVAKTDYTKDHTVNLGTTLFWTKPRLGDVDARGTDLHRTAMLTVYFYPEGSDA